MAAFCWPDWSACGVDPRPMRSIRHLLASPASLLVHLLLLAAVLWHVVTWFRILPKTLPKLVLRDRLVSQRLISTVALLLAFVCSATLVVAAMILGAWS